MFALFQKSDTTKRLVAIIVLLLAGVIYPQSGRAASISPEAALVRVFTVRPILPAWFAPSFLASISVAQVTQVIDGVEAQLGSYKAVAKQPDGSFLLRFKSGTASAEIALDSAGRIAGLSITNLKLVTIGPGAVGSVAARAAAVDALLLQRTRDHQFSGAVLVAVQGTVRLSKAYGYADAAHKAPNTIDTKFRIGSISKQFAAVAILQLQEVGKLSVHDTLCRYIQACPKSWAPITLQMLLTHTSGMPTDLTAPGAAPDITKPISSVQGVDYIKRVPLDRTPGASYEYSNANFDLLGYVDEQVSHVPYAAYLQARIFNPLSLGHSGYDNSRIDAPSHAIGYSTWAVPAPYLDISWLYAAGALYSTVGDLWRWDQALTTNVLLSKETTTDMFAAHAPICDSAASCGSYDAQAYGYGWVRAALGGETVIWHNGRLNGFVSMNEMLPKQGITIILLSNLENSGAEGVVGVQLAKIMLGV